MTLQEFKDLLKDHRLQEAANTSQDELIRVAKALGHEITDDVIAAYNAESKGLSDEDLGKVAGGYYVDEGRLGNP